MYISFSDRRFVISTIFSRDPDVFIGLADVNLHFRQPQTAVHGAV